MLRGDGLSNETDVDRKAPDQSPSRRRGDAGRVLSGGTMSYPTRLIIPTVIVGGYLGLGWLVDREALSPRRVPRYRGRAA